MFVDHTENRQIYGQGAMLRRRKREISRENGENLRENGRFCQIEFFSFSVFASLYTPQVYHSMI